jgi:hypothetical protein
VPNRGVLSAIPRAIVVSTDFGTASGRSNAQCQQFFLAPLLLFFGSSYSGSLNFFKDYCQTDVSFLPACNNNNIGDVIDWEITGSFGFSCSNGVWRAGLYSEAYNRKWAGVNCCYPSAYHKMIVSGTLTIPTDANNLPTIGSYSMTSPSAPGEGYSIQYTQSGSNQFCPVSWPTINPLPQGDYTGPQAITSFSITEY